MFIVGMGGGLYGLKKNKLEMSVIGAKIGLNYKNKKKGLFNMIYSFIYNSVWGGGGLIRKKCLNWVEL